MFRYFVVLSCFEKDVRFGSDIQLNLSCLYKVQDISVWVFCVSILYKFATAWDHSFACAYQGIRNVSFSEHFAYLVDE